MLWAVILKELFIRMDDILQLNNVLHLEEARTFPEFSLKEN